MIFNSIKKTNLIISARVRLLILFTMIISIFSILFETISIGMVVPIITTLLQSNMEGTFLFGFENNLFNNKNFEEKLKILLIFLSLIFISKIIFSLMSAILKMKLIHQFNNDLQLTLFKKYIFMDWEKYISRNPSILIRNIQSECSILKSGIVDALIILVTEIIFFIFIIILLILFIPTITFGIIFLIFFVSFIFFNLIKTKIKNYSKERLKISGFTFNYIIETLQSLKDIVIYNKQNFFINRFIPKNYSYHNYQRKIGILNSLPKIILEFIAFLLLLTSIIVLLNQQIPTEQLISTLGLLVIASSRLMPSSSKILVALQNIKSSQIVLENIYKEINENKIKSDENSNLENNFSTINLKDISYSYSKKTEIILKKVSIEINKNKSIAVVGKSGSGKSTLIEIISGLLKPTSGTITVDGKLVEDMKYFWGKKISYVSQKNFVFSDTLKTNITMESNDNKIDKSKLSEILKICRLDHYNLDKELKESGSNLSGGERQRISIARALYNKPNFLIFDEATNSLDQSLEKEIFDIIKSIKNITIIIISHNPNLVEFCDKIYLINDRELSEISNDSLK